MSIPFTRRQLLAAGAAPAMLRGANRPLNAVFILTDGLGAWALNSYGCRDLHSQGAPPIEQRRSITAQHLAEYGREAK